MDTFAYASIDKLLTASIAETLRHKSDCGIEQFCNALCIDAKRYGQWIKGKADLSPLEHIVLTRKLCTTTQSF